MTIAKVNGTEIFYTIEGKGDPIVLIPGLGCTHAYFGQMVPVLSERYQVISLDLRGVGQSAKPRQDYSMELWADDIAALLDQLEIPSAHILGSSLGGCVALAFGDRHLAKTKTLLLAATFSEIDKLLELNYRVRIGLIEKMGMSELVSKFAITALFGRSFFETEQGQQVAKMTIEMIMQNDPEMYCEHLRAVLRFGRCELGQENEPKYTAKLPNMNVPALITVGEEDVLTVAKFSKIMADGLPNAKLVIQERAGHVTITEQPVESGKLVLDFLSEL
jgi:pimeloyl-ACP methyl ester carboxylesterase